MQQLKSLLLGTTACAMFVIAGTNISCAKDVYAPSGQSVQQATNNIAARVFSEAERATIEEYFGYHPTTSFVTEEDDDDHSHGHGKGHGKGLPPGLAKKKHLPPGLQKQLERNGHLPPGLEKRALPHDLALKLHAAPKGTERVLIGNDVILLDKKSQLILDIINLATQ